MTFWRKIWRAERVDSLSAVAKRFSGRTLTQQKEHQTAWHDLCDALTKSYQTTLVCDPRSMYDGTMAQAAVFVQCARAQRARFKIEKICIGKSVDVESFVCNSSIRMQMRAGIAFWALSCDAPDGDGLEKLREGLEQISSGGRAGLGSLDFAIFDNEAVMVWYHNEQLEVTEAKVFNEEKIVAKYIRAYSKLRNDPNTRKVHGPTVLAVRQFKAEDEISTVAGWPDFHDSRFNYLKNAETGWLVNHGGGASKCFGVFLEENQGERLRGFVIAKAADGIYEGFMAVSRDCSGRGYGRLLVKFALDRLRDSHDRFTIEAKVRTSDMEKQINLYQALGFRLITESGKEKQTRETPVGAGAPDDFYTMRYSYQKP